MPREPQNPFEFLLRELIERPEGPAALGAMKMVEDALSVNRDVVEGVVNALAARIETPDAPDLEKRLDDAVKAWEKRCDAPMTPSLLDSLRQDAEVLVQKRMQQPPRCVEILDGWDAGARDLGYEIGGLLDGPEGTLHRLWSAISMDLALDAISARDKAAASAAGADEESAVDEIKRQFEAAIGRPMSEGEWGRLLKHAALHAERVMVPIMTRGR